jgi:NOL1/NOP2/fmu family ribosome biogenesis protein
LEGEGHYVAVLQHRSETSTEQISSVEDEKETVSKIDEDQGIAVTQPLSKADRKRERLMRTESRERNDRPARGGKNEGKAGRNNERDARKSNRGKGRGTDQVNIDPGTVYQQFIEEHLEIKLLGETVFYGDRVYQSSVGASRLEGLKVIRPGWFMGTVKNGRFVPSHPLACALNSSEARRVINLASASGEAVRYLKGETLNIEEARVECKSGAAAKGYALVCVDGYALGWGKWLDGVLKNEYPAGWRWTSV